MANRLLRLYILTREPSENLVLLAQFIMKVYTPMWFTIKTKPLCQYGAQYLWKMISLSREFPDKVKEIIVKVISTNAYFAHPENILLAMIANFRDHISKFGLRRILKARKELVNPRIFRVPDIKWDAKDYIDLIDRRKCTVTEPSLTMSISTDDLVAEIKNKFAITLKKFLCHTQAVERCVKIITEASSKVCGHDARDGYIRVKFEARSNLPSFENKTQYYNSKKRKRV